MKKLTLIFAAVLFVAVTAASAQSPTSDTTKNQRHSTDKNSKSGDKMSKDHNMKSGDQMSKDKGSEDKAGSNKNNDRTLVRSTDVPASLRQSLQGSSYTGWENGRVYKNKNGEYSVEINKNGMTKTHRFDASGKPVKE